MATSRFVQHLNGYTGSLQNLRYVGVVGTRESAPDAYDEVRRTLDLFRHGEDIVIVTGGARGYDQLGMRYAAEHGLPCDIYYPLWDELGKRAGYVRNRDIVSHSDVIFAWPGIGGAGTQHTVNIAHKMGVNIIVREVERWS